MIHLNGVHSFIASYLKTNKLKTLKCKITTLFAPDIKKYRGPFQYKYITFLCFCSTNKILYLFLAHPDLWIFFYLLVYLRCSTFIQNPSKIFLFFFFFINQNIKFKRLCFPFFFLPI